MCPVEETAVWVDTILRLLRERETDAAGWQARRAGGLDRAADFSWSRYTEGVVARYRAIAGLPAAATRHARGTPADAMMRVLHVGKFYPPHAGGIERGRRDALPVEPRARRESRARDERLARHDPGSRSTACT